MPLVIGEYVDRLCTIEIRPGSSNLPRGLMHRLYRASRDEGAPPLTFAMAEALVSTIKPHDAVFIVTGAGGPPGLPQGEVDGLLGAAAIARSLTLTLNANVVLLTEAHIEKPLEAACRAAELNFHHADSAETEGSVVYIPMPLDAAACERQAQQLLNSYSPTALIAIEKLSPNKHGVIHGSTGIRYDETHAKPQFLFNEARNRGILTAGIGDAGNEVGFGSVADAVVDIVPAGRNCRCPCGGGTIASVATDHLVVAAISNWGAYGVAAMITYLTASAPETLIDANDLERMLRACIDGGALDGMSARPVLADDGVPLTAQRSFVTMLREIILVGQSNLTSPGH